MDLTAIAFVTTVAGLILLVLINVSVPYVSTFYFLHSTIANGVRFGLFGWCLDDQSFCEGPLLGWTWDPNAIPWLTKSLVLYPIATVFTFFAAVSIIPQFCYKGYRHFPSPFFSIFIMLSFVAIFLAFIFTIALFVVARDRFHKQGFEATYGPSFWMALVATLVIMLLAMNTGCGSMCRGKLGRASENVAYNL